MFTYSKKCLSDFWVGYMYFELGVALGRKNIYSDSIKSALIKNWTALKNNVDVVFNDSSFAPFFCVINGT